MKSTLFFALLIMLNIVGFTQEVNPCYTEIDCDTLNVMIETQDPIVLDVRLHRAYKKERINGAQSAPNKEALRNLLENIDKNTTIVVYCREGVRSKTVSKIVCEELAFHNVYSLQKGFNGWKKGGYPIDTKKL